MFSVASAMVFVAIGLGDDASRIEPGHAENSVYVGVLEQGLEANGATVKLPEPRLRDGQAADVQRAALREVAGSDQKLDELVRNSVTAPYIIKVHDVKAEDATIRVIDLWFVVYADIAQIDPARQAEQADNKDVEAGNMAIRTRLLKPEDIRAAGIEPPKGPAGSGPPTWYAHIHGRLLDRIEFDATNTGHGVPDRRTRSSSPRGPTGRSTSRGRTPTAGSPSRPATRTMPWAAL